MRPKCYRWQRYETKNPERELRGHRFGGTASDYGVEL